VNGRRRRPKCYYTGRDFHHRILSNNAAAHRQPLVHPSVKLRLTQIKLAGFKSFVDPTAINVPGQLVGVVGPNGCGKSNIIDAVRWVLGESKASALRGESMQDVIFNGSALRKPVARASVELSFDNSLGKAAGQWSQYAEISVKRVLTRDGESSYFINNTHVRRRDVQDIFLGTGVGPRAYAIIEQGMISRVIEAKPEELRIFLEEAAGVSKYKERRRETENRLEDTRENLARVEDIRNELGTQIEKLTHQAEIARQYQGLAAEATLKQHILWLMRKQDAEAETQKHQREVERVTNELESETARLREIEKNLEALRADHYQAGDAANAAQGALYTVNTEVSRLEAEIRFIGETRQRLEAQAGQLALQLEQWQRQSGELAGALDMWRDRRVGAGDRVAAAQARATDERALLPALDQGYRDTQAKLAAARDAIAQAEQAFRLEQNTLSHLGKVLQQLEAREERLSGERAGLAEPDVEQLSGLEGRIADADVEIEGIAERLASLQEAVPVLEAARAAALARLQELQNEASQLEGRLDALQRIQARVEDNEQIQDWLEKYGLGTLPRLWQKITVEPGWEQAIESVLRERLHALELTDPDVLQRLLDDPPPAKVSVFGGDSSGMAPSAGEHRPLASLVQYSDPSARALVEDWLSGCFAVDGVPRLMTRLALAPGAVLVNRAGHQFTRFGVSFHGPDSGDAGILARQREIEGLIAERGTFDVKLSEARQVHRAAEEQLTARREQIADLQEQESGLRQRRHELQLEHLRLVEGAERIRSRGEQIADELAEIHGQKEAELANQTAAEANLERHQAEIDRLYEAFDGVKAEFDAAQQALDAQRQSIQRVELEVQELEFAARECEAKIGEIERQIGALAEQVAGATERVEQARLELATLEDESLKDELQGVLAQRVEREQTLADARNLHEDLGQRLRLTEEERLSCEQRLNPLRDRIGELRLKEQAARLSFEQHAQQLLEAGADEAAVAAAIEKGMRPNALQADINRLHQEMAELGAINMAALEELATSTERKNFLDAQATDLAQALETLESAIRRIDRETRDMLQQTFDEANAHFARMFPTLFGGGEAKLVMTGDEILNAGVEVRAQPPGKRNTSIHLLSGGEKALTATALIFSLFQLNPAPFCLLDEVDAPLDDTNTERFCNLVRKMSDQTQFLFISHNKITMELAHQLVGVTMQEQGVSRVVAVDIEEALRLKEAAAA
jgi:chromosome segregation protein